MRNSFYIALSLALFGALVTYVTNTSILFDMTLTGATMPFTDSTVTQLVEASAAAEANPIGGVTILPVLINTVLGGLLSMFYIIPIAVALGIPAEIAVIFEIGLLLVYMIDVALYLRGIPPI